MNAFQILDADGQAISINELDKQAAEFWGKPVHDKNYANPFVPKEGMSELERIRGEMCSNWYDIVGWTIANQGNACSGWANIAASLMAESLGMLFIDTSTGYNDRPVKIHWFDRVVDGEVRLSKDLERQMFGTLEFYRPFIELINHWQSKGYTPKQVIE